jgi:hypothetical protein
LDWTIDFHFLNSHPKTLFSLFHFFFPHLYYQSLWFVFVLVSVEFFSSFCDMMFMFENERQRVCERKESEKKNR